MLIEVNLSPEQVKILENDLLDLEKWVVGAVKGKVNKCKKRLMKTWFQKLMMDENVSAKPADEAELLNMIFAHPDYKNRKQREEEES